MGGEVEAILKDTDLEEKADTQVTIRPKMMSVIHTQTSVLIIFHTIQQIEKYNAIMYQHPGVPVVRRSKTKTQRWNCPYWRS